MKGAVPHGDVKRLVDSSGTEVSGVDDTSPPTHTEARHTKFIIFSSYAPVINNKSKREKEPTMGGFHVLSIHYKNAPAALPADCSWW